MQQGNAGGPGAPGARKTVTAQVRPLPPQALARLFGDARLYPLRFVGDALDFVPMTYETYRRSTFLDRRIQPALPQVFRAGAAEVAAAAEAAPPAPPPGWVFHSAYCCSTLLAAALALLPRMLVLKEPVTLLQLALGEVEPARTPLVQALLSRRDHPDDRVVVKASSNCSVTGADLLRQMPQARAVFLHSGLEDFLLAVVKDPARAARMRATLAEGRPPAALGMWWPAGEPAPAADGLDDARLAAFVWIGRLRALARMRAVAGPERVAAIDGTALAADPAAPLKTAADALGLGASDDDLARVLAADIWHRHAKAPAIAYGREQRAREQAELAARHRPALDAALDFARRLLAEGADPTFELPRSLAGL